MKKCNQCHEFKALEQFFKRTKSPDGRQFVCKSCHKKRKKIWEQKNKKKCVEYANAWRKRNPDKFLNTRLKTNYGITLEQKRTMYSGQREKCAICTEKLESLNRAYVDHDHKTKLVRGLTCRDCNSALGLIKENYATAVSMAGYIMRHKGVGHVDSASL